MYFVKKRKNLMQSALLSHKGKCECDGCGLLTVQPAGPVDVIKLIFFIVAVTCLVSLVSAGTGGRASWISVKVRFAVYYVLSQIKQRTKTHIGEHVGTSKKGNTGSAARALQFNFVFNSGVVWQTEDMKKLKLEEKRTWQQRPVTDRPASS